MEKPENKTRASLIGLVRTFKAGGRLVIITGGITKQAFDVIVHTASSPLELGRR